MKNETKAWLSFAEENLNAALALLEKKYYNASLQNAQQSVEKNLKALLIDKVGGLKKTHSTNELLHKTVEAGLSPIITEEECSLFDSIYLPSKYPLIGIIPAFKPNKRLCRKCITIAQRINKSVRSILQ
jgi:HEPN domain-containing protein